MPPAPLRPPVGLSPTELLTQWLPDALAEAGLAPTSDAPVVRLTLAGAGGGDFTLTPGDDGWSVLVAPPGPARSNGAQTPELWIRQSAADFRATLESDPDLPSILPEDWSVLDLLFLDPRDAQLVRQVNGRAVVEIDGRRRRRWALDAAFGKAGVTAGRARATIRLDGGTFEALARGEKPPLQAFLEGKIKVDGDRALATQLLLVVASRLARSPG